MGWGRARTGEGFSTVTTTRSTTPTAALAVDLADDAVSIVDARVRARHLGVQATGTVTVAAKGAGLTEAGKTMVLYGVTLEITEGGSPGPGNVACDINDISTAAQIRDRVISVINAAASFGTTASSGGGAVVNLESIDGGTSKNVSITGTLISGAIWTTTNMTGGANRSASADAVFYVGAGFSTDSGTATQLGAGGASGTTTLVKYPAGTPLACHLDADSGNARVIVTGNTAIDIYEWSVAATLT